MRIAIGSDHRGFPIKETVKLLLAELGHQAQDFGCEGTASVDYPDVAGEVARAVAQGRYDCGILVCGTGIGMSISANKVRGVRAALASEPFSARMARAHNDANVLCMGAEVVGPALARDIVTAYLAASFEGGRHARRVQKIAALEEGGAPASSPEARRA